MSNKIIEIIEPKKLELIKKLILKNEKTEELVNTRVIKIAIMYYDHIYENKILYEKIINDDIFKVLNEAFAKQKRFGVHILNPNYLKANIKEYGYVRICKKSFNCIIRTYSLANGGLARLNEDIQGHSFSPSSRGKMLNMNRKYN